MNKSNNNSNGRGQKRPASAMGPKQNGGAPKRPRVANEGQAQRPFVQPKPRQGAGPLVGVAAAYASGQRSSAPRIQASRDQCRIVHRELIASVTGSVAFTVAQSLALNPGLAASFPWLSTQAQCWERYRFNKLKFCYYTRTGSNVPGSVILAPDYDAADSAPVSEQVASSYEDVEEDAPWKDISCDLKPSSLHALGPTKFIRNSALAANQDIKTYDAGNLFLATIDGTAVPWGKLWVEYDISLFSPQLPPGGGVAAAAFNSGSTTPSSTELIPAATAASGSVPLVSVTNEIITFLEAGRFYVVYTVAGTTCTVTAAPVISADGTLSSSSSAGSGAAALIQQQIVTAVVGTTLTYNNTLAAGTSARLIVCRLPASLAAA